MPHHFGPVAEPLNAPVLKTGEFPYKSTTYGTSFATLAHDLRLDPVELITHTRLGLPVSVKVRILGLVEGVNLRRTT